MAFVASELRFDTCVSLVKVVEAVKTFAPEAKLYAVGTHGYFSKDAAEKVAKMIAELGLEWIAVTNCISQRMRGAETSFSPSIYINVFI